MRIVGGRFRGRSLQAPKSSAIRPSADRLRESLFNILTHGYGDPVTDARVLDLFAGTGALGLEALSRGASFVLFIDDSAEARALLRANVEALGAGGQTRIFRRDATRLGAAHPLEPFSLVFLDPPYAKGHAEKALASAREGDWLTPDALIIVEEAMAAKFSCPVGFEEIERRTYDDTELIFLRVSDIFDRRGEGKQSMPRTRKPSSLAGEGGERSEPEGEGTQPSQRRPNRRSISESFSST